MFLVLNAELGENAHLEAKYILKASKPISEKFKRKRPCLKMTYVQP